jgi:hypothetical protein
MRSWKPRVIQGKLWNKCMFLAEFFGGFTFYQTFLINWDFIDIFLYRAVSNSDKCDRTLPKIFNIELKIKFVTFLHHEFHIVISYYQLTESRPMIWFCCHLVFYTKRNIKQKKKETESETQTEHKFYIFKPCVRGPCIVSTSEFHIAWVMVRSVMVLLSTTWRLRCLKKICKLNPKSRVTIRHRIAQAGPYYSLQNVENIVNTLHDGCQA